MNQSFAVTGQVEFAEMAIGMQRAYVVQGCKIVCVVLGRIEKRGEIGRMA